MLLARGGLRTTLQARTEEQASVLREQRENHAYLTGVELPRELRIESADAGVARADYVFLGVPSMGLGSACSLVTIATSPNGLRHLYRR